MTAVPSNVSVPATPAVEASKIEELYELHKSEVLGKGAFSIVIKATNRSNGAIRAMKIMDLEQLSGKKRVMEMVLHEKEILRRTQHPNVVSLYQFIRTPTHVFFEEDLMKTDLFDYLVAHGRLYESEAKKVMHQLLSAVAYLHDINIVHRDIKPENILFNSPDDVKLADFGLAKMVENWHVDCTPCGTSFYIAPEIIHSIQAQGGKPLTTNQDDVKRVDLWSCGVVMFIVLSGRTPLKGGKINSPEERRRLLRQIDALHSGGLFDGPVWETVSDDAKDLVLKLLTQDPAKRINAHTALQHPFFASAQQTVAESEQEVQGTPPPSPCSVDRGEINEIMEELRDEGDKEGEKTAFKPAPIVEAPADEVRAPRRMVGKKLPGAK